jgi:signal transduction histidine kinase
MAVRLAPLAVVLVGGCVIFAIAATYRRRERVRRFLARQSALREGAELTIRTLRHHLANKLGVAVGYSELLAEDPRLPLDLEQQAQLIRTSALAAIAAVDKFQDHLEHVELDTSVAGPALLDVERSTAQDCGRNLCRGKGRIGP